MPDPTPPLSYDRPANAGIPRWQFRLLLLLVLLNLAITIQSVYAPGVAAAVKQRWAAHQAAKQARAIQQQAMTYTQPAGKVIWDEDPATAAALLATPDYRVIEIRGRERLIPVPLPFGARARLPGIAGPLFVNLLPGYPNAIQPEETALVFLHGRISKAGEALVCVGAKGDASLGLENPFRPGNPGGMPHDKPWTATLGRRLSIVASASDFSTRTPARAVPREDRIAELVIERGDWETEPAQRAFGGNRYAPATLRWTPPQGERPGTMSLDAAGAFRLYAGQPDPKDPSHFTIDYDYAGRRGTIHGYLKDNGGVELKPDAGTVTGPTWKPPAGPPDGRE